MKSSERLLAPADLIFILNGHEGRYYIADIRADLTDF